MYNNMDVVSAGLPYSMAIDMWSFGAILAELYTGYPLFPGENEAEQLACIMELFGTPSPSILSEAQRRKLFFGMLAGNSSTIQTTLSPWPGGIQALNWATL